MLKSISIPFGLLGALALIVAVEYAIETRGNLLATYSGLGARFASKAATAQAKSAAILGFGDSVMKFGFDPESIQRQSGRSAYNLAVPGTPPPLALALLRKALNAGAKPEAIVVGTMTLAGSPKVHVSDFAEAFTLRDAYELARDAERPELFGEIATARALPSYRYRHALRGAFLAPLKGSQPESQTPALSKLQTWTAHSGHEPRTPNGAFDGRMEPELEKRVYSSPWLVEAAFEKGLRRLVKLAADRGIAVYWVVPPISPLAQERREALGLDAPHTRNLQAILSRMANTTLIDARTSGYPASAFFDSCHLNAEGAATLSSQIGQVLIRQRNGERFPDRWVTLPRWPNKTDGLAAKKGETGRR